MIALSVAVALLCIVELALIHDMRLFKNNLENFAETHNKLVDAYKQDSTDLHTSHFMLQSMVNKHLEEPNPTDEIKEIFERLDKIVADIERIDRDEKDLRTYYVNYREPTILDTTVTYEEPAHLELTEEENEFALPFPGDPIPIITEDPNYFTESEQMEGDEDGNTETH